MVTRAARVLTSHAVVIALTALVGCTIPESPIAPGAKRVVVHAVLDLGADTQSVQLRYSDVVNYTAESVKGATVTITGPAGVTMTAVEDTGQYHQPVYRFIPRSYGVTLTPG